jgi:hypothetical protein
MNGLQDNTLTGANLAASIASIAISAATCGFTMVSVNCTSLFLYLPNLRILFAGHHLIRVRANTPQFVAAQPLTRVLPRSYDVHPARRKDPSQKQFYGYVPDTALGRTGMFVTMCLNNAIMLIIRSMGMALMLASNTRALASYLLADYAIYIIQMIVRSSGAERSSGAKRRSEAAERSGGAKR